jgi:hypothetical protein
MEPQRSTFDIAGNRGGTVAGESGGRQVGVTVTTQDDQTLVMVTFSEKP